MRDLSTGPILDTTWRISLPTRSVPRNWLVCSMKSTFFRLIFYTKKRAASYATGITQQATRCELIISGNKIICKGGFVQKSDTHSSFFAIRHHFCMVIFTFPALLLAPYRMKRRLLQTIIHRKGDPRQTEGGCAGWKLTNANRQKRSGCITLTAPYWQKAWSMKPNGGKWIGPYRKAWEIWKDSR